jgi:glycyl-tRNA synthetase beta chain
MEEQYLPRHAGDRLPESDCGLAVSVADRLDTLVGIFAIGQRPTGVKDPYGLRRAAIGLLRVLIETPLALNLKEALAFTAETLRDKVDARTAASEVFTYSMERLKGYYQDQGIGGDVVDSVLAIGPEIPSDTHRRILAVDSFRLLPEAAALTAANKRIRNILRKNPQTSSAKDLDPSILQDEAEHRLTARVSEMQSAIGPLLAEQDYEGILKSLALLRDDVDAFFDQVMVMAEDPKLRENRLALLQSVEALFLQVADISLLKQEHE